MDDNWQNPDGEGWARWAEPSTPADPRTPAGPPGLEQLQKVQSDLWRALRQEEDPELRMNLLSRLSENRAAILALDAERIADRPGPTSSGPDADGVGLARSPGGPWADEGHPLADPGFQRRQPAPSSAFALAPSAFPDDGPAYGQGPSPAGPPLMPPPPMAPGGRRRSPTAAQASGTGDPGTASTLPEAAARALTVARDRLRPLVGRLGDPRSAQRILVLGGALVSVLAIGWLIMAQPFGGDGETAAGGTGETVASETTVARDALVERINLALQNVGQTSTAVSLRGDALVLGGTVATENDKQIVVALVQALAAAEGAEVIVEVTVAPPGTTGAPASDPTTSRAAALQAEINRVVAATPLIFETGETDLAELHVRILNNVASILRAYPGVAVKIIGYTDHVGSADANVTLSEKRAASVKAYLVSQGVPEVDLITEARGSTTSTGSSELASLERRVEFEVVAVPAAAPSDKAPLRVAIVAPSAANDLAFTQSMVDALNVVAAERGNVAIDITDSTFVPAEAAAAIRAYAEGDYDLIIAHGVEFGTELLTIVKDHPDIVFAWGTATDTFGLPNLYAYDAAAEEGGYVMGAMAAQLSATGTVGVVGPIEVGDAKRYIDGFSAGAGAEKPGIKVPVTYTNSFGDITLASETATAHLAAGADVLTGTAEMVVGAIQVAHDNKVLWFGTQANQASLAPDVVVASQVYHWEVLLRQVVADIDAGTPNGRSMVAKLDNGGLVLEYNPAYALPPAVRQRADQLTADIASGALTVPRG